jgi:hypothetical protein
VFHFSEDIKKFRRDPEEVKFVSLTPSVVTATSIITSSPKPIQVSTTQAIQPTSTLVVNVDRLTTIYKSRESTRSSSPSSSRPHSVSVPAVSDTQRLPATSVAPAIGNPSLKTTKPASKTFENSATSAGQHGNMKLFRFILSFHIIREGMLYLH